MGERHSEHARDPHDWYVEPAWCVEALLRRDPLIDDVLHDPCCGLGTIPDAAAKLGITATGADLVDRADGRFSVRDFLTDNRRYSNIVTNPPFGIATQIIERALNQTVDGGIVAAICQAKFLFSQKRHALFTRPEMERVLVFSRRPSMPPGEMLIREGEAFRGGGSIDYVWCVWRVKRRLLPACQVEWVP